MKKIVLILFMFISSSTFAQGWLLADLLSDVFADVFNGRGAISLTYLGDKTPYGASFDRRNNQYWNAVGLNFDLNFTSNPAYTFYWGNTIDYVANNKTDDYMFGFTTSVNCSHLLHNSIDNKLSFRAHLGVGFREHVLFGSYDDFTISEGVIPVGARLNYSSFFVDFTYFVSFAHSTQNDWDWFDDDFYYYKSSSIHLPHSMEVSFPFSLSLGFSF